MRGRWGTKPLAVVTSQGPAGRRDVRPDRRAFFDRLVGSRRPISTSRSPPGAHASRRCCAGSSPTSCCASASRGDCHRGARGAAARLVNSHPSRLPRYRGPSPIAGRCATASPSSASRSTGWTSSSTRAACSRRARCRSARRLDAELQPRFGDADARAAHARVRAGRGRRPGRCTGRRRGELRRLLRGRVRRARLGLARRTSSTAASARGASSSAGAAVRVSTSTGARPPGADAGRARQLRGRPGDVLGATHKRCSSAAARTRSGCSSRSPPPRRAPVPVPPRCTTKDVGSGHRGLVTERSCRRRWL